MKFNERALKGLIEESQDLQSGAMRDARESRAELREIGASRAGQAPDLDRLREYSVGRRHLLKTGGFGLGILALGGLLSTAFGQRAAAIVNRPLQADVDVDIQIFQTASSLENLAVATYGAALTLPFIKDGNKVVVAFAETTMMQHDEHSAAFNAMAKELGGKEQTETNSKYQAVVDEMLPSLTDAPKVVEFAAVLETVATQTYNANMVLLEDTDIKALMASVMGVEAQHLATLRAVGALLGAGEEGAALIALDPTVLAKLPAEAGSVAFPEPFEGTEMASPPEEGAVK